MVNYFRYLAKIVDIKNAFLYGEHEEENYTAHPQGMSDIEKDVCVIFNKCICSLVNTTKSLQILPCLYIKKTAKCIVYVALYIDDILMVSKVEAIDNATSTLKNNGLSLKVMEGLQDYLSCKIKFSKDKKRSWPRQPHLTKNFEKKCGEHILDVWSHKTPGMPKFLVVRPMVESKMGILVGCRYVIVPGEALVS